MRLPLLFTVLAAPAFAGVPEVVSDHIQPGFAQFAQATQALAEAAGADCTAIEAPYQSAFDAWMGVSHLAFGPLEQGGRNLAVSFWPDTRGMVPKTVAKLIADEDAAALDPAAFAEVSVAGRGLYALETVLQEPYAQGSYTCTYAAAVADDLARVAREVQADWQAYGALLLDAGAEGNATYLSEKEAATAIYTALMTGLEFTSDTRIGRPLGTFDRPRPKRAEAWRSGRSLRNVTLSLQALRDLARALAGGEIPVTEAAFADALSVAADLDDPIFAGVADPMGRLRVEILQQRVDLVRDAVAGEIGTPLGLAAGFNSADGD
ncbi:imelysin family protein [Tropicibacter naphthalenivorans]|uniref:Iron-regulated protein A n=1 Tax=Tropicibacter naphthalenivorans TaxID=441103 RepID=A0A0N7LYN3_9RHOB|nr:imelysin family protein [Tropicibacter naphthalenivorans]CUH75345.1 Iron-regulated protein A precursor [Tropicibacter naphthalenivorans]SMC44961.1 hypothetical protein SAMN04488093_101487 [Tropicibacter naphthalenivorans]